MLCCVDTVVGQVESDVAPPSSLLAHHDVVMTYEARDRFFIHLQGKTFEQVCDDV